ncbi:MAG: hypothetical protein HY700_12630 [Gemmatimonadetes bacterium]|nr:hypothetical protein [Gemmatimonadota bacterium]
MITVPSCEPCNKSFELDDDYFKQHLALRRDIEAHPRAATLLAEVRRSWARPEGGGLKAYTVGTLVQRPSPAAALELGQYIDSERIGTVLGRTVRGLYFHHTGRRIPPSYRARAILSEAATPDFQLAFECALFSSPDYALAEGMFAYSFAAASDDPMSTVWLLQFYGNALFYAMTGAPKVAA